MGTHSNNRAAAIEEKLSARLDPAFGEWQEERCACGNICVGDLLSTPLLGLKHSYDACGGYGPRRDNAKRHARATP
jgi:hypothetical protein